MAVAATSTANVSSSCAVREIERGRNDDSFTSAFRLIGGGSYGAPRGRRGVALLRRAVRRAVPGDGLLQPRFESGLRFVAEQAARLFDVGLRVAHIAGARRGKLRLDRGSHQRTDRLEETVQ